MNASLFVEAGGLRMHCTLAGLPQQPVVMFCHGLLGTLRMWQAQAVALAGRYRVLRFDNRGHGLTAVTPPPYDVDVLADDAVALLDALGLARVHFVGCSLGGMIGQALAMRHGARLASLVLVGSRSVMPPVSLWEERIRIAREQGIAPLVPTMLERWFTPAYRAQRPAEVDAVARGVLATPVDGFVGACTAIRDMDHRQRLASIATPTLVVSGDEDPGVPLDDTRFLATTIPGARMHVVAGARHLFAIERADEFNALLADWLREHTGGGR